MTITQYCVLLSFNEFIDYYRQTESELRKRGNAGDKDAMDQANALRKKLDSPEEVYALFANSAQKYLRELGKVEGTVGFGLVREAAVGKQDAPRKIMDILSDKGKLAEAAVPYVISLGDILQAQGNLSGARTTYDEALRTMPQNGAILRKYANLLMEMSNTSQAITMLETALKNDETQQRLSNVDLAYIYSALGEASQGIGKLDVANDRFRIARQLGRAAAKDGSLDKAQYASILNDSAGAAIRSRDLKGAQESLCTALANYQASGSDERSAITSELNLAVVLREMGHLGESKLVLGHAEERISKLPSIDPFRGFLPLLAGILHYMTGDDRAAFVRLEEAQKFFEPAYRQAAAYSQRLGRISDIRGRIQYRNGDLAAAKMALSDAARYFNQSFGPISFDGLTVDFWTTLVAADSRDRQLTDDHNKRFNDGLAGLGLSGQLPWTNYRMFLSKAVQIGNGRSKQEPATLKDSTGPLFDFEKASGAYDLMADAAIIFALRNRLSKADGISVDEINRFRDGRGALKASVVTTKTFDEVCAAKPDK